MTTRTDDLSRRVHERYGPWAVVTGASSGIGREMAIWLAGAGVHVVLVARGKDALDSLARELGARTGVSTRVIAADLGAREGNDAVLDATADLDVGLLVAAAGFGTSGPFVDQAVEPELTMLQVNCGSTLSLAHGFARRFVARGKGGLVLMGSIVGFQGTPYAASYAATKAYVQSLAEALHVELAGSGVDVVSSAPGPTESGFAERANMRMTTTMRARDVVRPTLAALGRRPTVSPGALTKLLTWSLAFLPRTLRTRIMGRVMHGMTLHEPGGRSAANARLH